MNEQFACKISAEDKKAIEDMTKEALYWMDAHQEATKEEYEAKMKEVEGKIQPIFTNLYHAGGIVYNNTQDSLLYLQIETYCIIQQRCRISYRDF